ncbi:hypothetical protein BATDEDRAFT_27116 [Batrachochytrium dendrobatidis JAM81]|uniref:Anaphase-promoting complex subunit 4 WD40 domain-containing protein n=1 Tax=Batrachochytrium dendrobatidis (strain JAM81 / FGSC 10211) TaxID=684364 RepID=F4PA42_BATDJ|nr:uncharacterized protein BATDEDRAFT_27116 [Batrachochytrium dendrobatidis JAM81]EGF77837.1 hypothetical protein BATDEDRAFT_27116 [Batrachochytrium dendrobatidis JAM81]|eukprot:XP_006681383.1 hypothetical protein BATDEDRAFT_27116 [Batrachochytrium dendrobatidis JAM81]
MNSQSKLPCIIGSTGSRFSKTTTNRATDPFDSTLQPNYFKSLQWSPDGQCILTNSFDNTLRLFDAGSALYENPTTTSVVDLVESLQIKSAEPVYDMKWYPFMSSSDPSTSCFVSCSRDHPVQLWDAYTGQASYIDQIPHASKNHVDQVCAPISLAFNLDGTKIFCGFDGQLQIFNTGRPGTDCEIVPLTPNKKSRDGTKGLVSSIAFSPDQSGLYGVGTYAGSISLYDSLTHNPIQTLKPSTRSGVCQIHFTPTTATTLLFAASRQSTVIDCWDLRMMGHTPLGRFHRDAQTQQRLAFDIGVIEHGMHLVAGDKSGTIRVYDVISALDHAAHSTTSTTADHTDVLEIDTPWCEFKNAANASIGATQFHPFAPVIAMCSGERVQTWERNIDLNPDTPIVANSNEPELDKHMECRLSILKWDTAANTI